MGSKEKPGRFDCYTNALPDEPMFILLARDPYASILVKLWADLREREIFADLRPKEDFGMVDEAVDCAEKMTEWRKQNDGKWRHKG